MNIIKLNSIHPKSAMIDCVHSHKSCLFQSTTHEECDLGSLGFTELIVCFNPRTHEECDQRNKNDASASLVSIHALTRSATWPEFFASKTAAVSIHALTRSATLQTHCIVRPHWFQSTHSRGVRHPDPRKILFIRKFQSTHSRGVRPRQGEMPYPLLCFNPRTHEECDFTRFIRSPAISCFNPRTHEECDRI